jgi:hypothetical protein
MEGQPDIAAGIDGEGNGVGDGLFRALGGQAHGAFGGVQPEGPLGVDGERSTQVPCGDIGGIGSRGALGEDLFAVAGKQDGTDGGAVGKRQVQVFVVAQGHEGGGGIELNGAEDRLDRRVGIEPAVLGEDAKTGSPAAGAQPDIADGIDVKRGGGGLDPADGFGAGEAFADVRGAGGDEVLEGEGIGKRVARQELPERIESEGLAGLTQDGIVSGDELAVLRKQCGGMREGFKGGAIKEREGIGCDFGDHAAPNGRDAHCVGGGLAGVEPKGAVAGLEARGSIAKPTPQNDTHLRLGKGNCGGRRTGAICVPRLLMAEIPDALVGTGESGPFQERIGEGLEHLAGDQLDKTGGRTGIAEPSGTIGFGECSPGTAQGCVGPWIGDLGDGFGMGRGSDTEYKLFVAITGSDEGGAVGAAVDEIDAAVAPALRGPFHRGKREVAKLQGGEPESGQRPGAADLFEPGALFSG